MAEKTVTEEIEEEVNNGYDAPTNVNEVEVINTYELEEKAKKVVPKGGFDYMSGASGDEFTLKQNIEAWNAKGILPRVLADVEFPGNKHLYYWTRIKSSFYYVTNRSSWFSSSS